MTFPQHPAFITSPSDSSPEPNHSSYDEEIRDSKDDITTPQQPAKRKSNGRKGPENVDKRATHNAIERARRESLNGRFSTLADALPSMSKVKRPSKSVIVTKALEFVYDAQLKEHALIKENNELRREVDSLRARLGIAPLPPPSSLLQPSSISTNHAKLDSGLKIQSRTSPQPGAENALPSPVSVSGGTDQSPVLAYAANHSGLSMPAPESPASSPPGSFATEHSSESPILSGPVPSPFQNSASTDPLSAYSHHQAPVPFFPPHMNMMSHPSLYHPSGHSSNAHNTAHLSPETLLLAAQIQRQKDDYQRMQQHHQPPQQQHLPFAPSHSNFYSSMAPPPTFGGHAQFNTWDPTFPPSNNGGLGLADFEGLFGVASGHTQAAANAASGPTLAPAASVVTVE